MGFADQVAVERWLARALAPHASAMLVDPNDGYPAAADLLQPQRGLMLTLEDHRFDDSPQGRRSHAIDHWSVGQIRRPGLPPTCGLSGLVVEGDFTRRFG